MIEKQLANIKDGFSVSPKEGKLLFNLARQADKVIVEIGSWKGYSTLWLAMGSKVGNNAMIYAIDTFQGDVNNYKTGEGETYSEFLKNIKDAGVDDIVTIKRMTSEQAFQEWDGTRIDLLWIDGNHNEIEADYERWYNLLNYTGIIAIHDTTAWTSMLPYKLSIRELYKSGKFWNVKRVGSITYAIKNIEYTFVDKIANHFALLRRYVYQAFLPYYNSVKTMADKFIRGFNAES